MKIAIAPVFIWIGALKYVPYEGQHHALRGQQPLDVVLLCASRRTIERT